MISLRPLKAEDAQGIKLWPSYVDGFAEMDYALREKGWIDEFQSKPGTWIYIAEAHSATVGFSLLSTSQKGEAEFRIAIHPHWIGKGMGKAITLDTLKLGFEEKNLDKIDLIVRKTNHAAARLYQKLGFAITGASLHVILGQSIEFTDMSMSKQSFYSLINSPKGNIETT